jgi:hypothetical protein
MQPVVSAVAPFVAVVPQHCLHFRASDDCVYCFCFLQVADAAGMQLVVPPARWCTDNGVMVGWAGIER